MTVKQIALIIPNIPGSLQKVTDIMKMESVNIRAITVMDPGEDAIVRLMVDDHERACNALRSKGFEFVENEVIPMEIPDHPGGLNATLTCLSEAGININQVNSYIGRSGDNAILIIAVSSEDGDRARAILKQNWVHILDENVYTL